MRKIFSIFMSLLVAVFAMQEIFVVLIIPFLTFVLAQRAATGRCDYHDLVVKMNWDLLYVALTVCGSFMFLVFDTSFDALKIVISSLVFISAYYSFAYSFEISSFDSLSSAKCGYGLIVSIAVLFFGVAPHAALDYARLLLADPGWVAADEKTRIHMISSASLYVALVPVAGLSGGQSVLFGTVLLRRLLGNR